MILVDTNVLTAAAYPGDNLHQAAAGFLEAATEPLLVPPTVVAEVCYLLNAWSGPVLEANFLRNFSPSRPEAERLALAELTPEDLDRMAALVERYGDMPLGGTDASVVAIAERLYITQVATFDRRHFTVVRPNHVEAFTLLP